MYWALLASVVLYLLSRLNGAAYLGLVACAIGAAAACHLGVGLLLRNVVVERVVPERVCAGEPVTIRYEVTNSGWLPLPGLRLKDEIDGLEPVTLMLPMLRPRAQAAPTVETHAIARGYYERRTVDVAAATPLGSASRSVTTSTTPMTVHPKRVRAIPIWVAVAGGTSGTIDRPGRGVDVHGLRSWHHGDAAGSVHWRSTAKRNELLVLERADDAGGGLAVLAGGLTPGEYAEDLIAQAAAVAVAAVREGRRTALFAASLPAYDTTVDRVAILDWFAKLPVDETPSMPLAAAAARTAGAEGVVLWLSTDPPTTEIVHTVRRFGASLLPVARTAGR